MDGKRFDELAMIWARRGQSRRTALRGFGAALLAALGMARGGAPDEVMAKGCFVTGRRCRRGAQCCSGRCRRGKCAACPNGQKECGHGCVNLNTDERHCGGCDQRCVTGQHCVDGACQCNGAACSGCCDGTNCVAVSAQNDGMCGSNGVACFGCAAGQHCVDGQCVCDAQSCPDGCCDGATCRGDDDGACGIGGGACTDCAAQGLDCDGATGVCVCNQGGNCQGCCDGASCQPGTSGGACGTNGQSCVQCVGGQACVNGVCVCTPESCPNGCCLDNHCHESSNETCGEAAYPCVTCLAGQVCQNGACRCNGTSCPDGCCSATNRCLNNSDSTCGIGGGVCVSCPVGQRCVNGQCICDATSCGAAGQRCLNGQCVCDATSCPDGCCDRLTCRANSNTYCGTGGGACFACGLVQTCVSGVCLDPACNQDGFCRVFVTFSAATGAVFGSLAGADGFCQREAEAAGLPGRYKAWLSDTTGSPATRFTKSSGPYKLVNAAQTQIAAHWLDLIDGNLAAPINVHATGAPVTTAQECVVWTATDLEGLAEFPFTYSCRDWTSQAEADSGLIGYCQTSDWRWTKSGESMTCRAGGRLYCFEQW